jgi:hypothetical protein
VRTKLTRPRAPTRALYRAPSGEGPRPHLDCEGFPDETAEHRRALGTTNYVDTCALDYYRQLAQLEHRRAVDERRYAGIVERLPVRAVTATAQEADDLVGVNQRRRELAQPSPEPCGRHRRRHVTTVLRLCDERTDDVLRVKTLGR